MRLNKRIIQTFIISSILFTTPINIFADTNKDISIDRIFTNDDGLWYPGRIESKDFSIRNNRKEKIIVDRLYIELNSIKDIRNNVFLDKSSKEYKELSKNSIFKLTNNGNILFEGELDEIISKNNIVLHNEISINPNEKAVLNMTIDMLEEMNNDAQGLESVFNIGVSYKVDENISVDNDVESKPDKPVKPGTDNNVKPNSDKPIKPDTDVYGSNKLPQTGGLINSYNLIALGIVTIGTGILLNKKSSKEKGGKHHE